MKTAGVMLAVLLSVVLPTETMAAADPSPAQGSADAADKPPPLEELKEVWIRGKRLSNVIEDAEDDFFDLYNKLNRDNQYDVYCGSMALYNSSMIMVRKCVPGFIAHTGDAFGRVRYTQFGGAFYGSTGYYGGSRFGAWGAWPDSPYSDYGYNSFYTGYGYGDAFAYAPSIPVYAGPSSAELLMSKRPAYGANLLKVVNSDPQLLEMVRGLDVLYKEMDQVKGHYVQVKAEVRASRKPAKPYLTPRHN